MATVANTTIRVTDQASPALRNINIALTANLTGFERLERALHDNTAALNRARGASGNYTVTQRQVATATRQTATATDGLVSKLKGLAAAYLGVQTAQRFMTETDNFIHNQARLDIMNDGLQTTDELYRKLYASAQRSLAPMNDVIANVTKLGIVAGEAFSSNDEIISFVETFNKAATVSGASQSEKQNAMYQLSQAFASGRLQGDELRSVRENAPMLFKAIQEELERQYGEGVDFRRLAADGLITPDVIKRAAFASAAEIDEAFNNMPLSFGDMMIQSFNKVRAALTPIFKEMQAIINSPGFKQALNTVTNYVIQGLWIVWNVVKAVGKAVMWVIGIVKKLAPVLKPLAIGIGTVVALTYAYIAALKIWAMAVAVAKGAALLFASAKMVLGFATSFATARTMYQTMAQWGLNKAQMVGLMLTWKVILIVLALVAVIALVIKYLDYVTGAVYVTGAAIWNTIVGLYNGFLSILDAIMAPVMGLIEWLYNAFTGGFEGIGGACLNIIGQIVSNALGVIKPILEVWDSVTGDDAAGAITRAQNAARNWGKSENGTSFSRSFLRDNLGADSRIGYGDAWNTGKAHGAAGQDALGGAWNKAKGMFTIPGMGDIDSAAGVVGTRGENPFLAEIAQNTGETADNTAQQAEDDYELLRDVMAQRAVSRISNGGTVKVEMTNNNNLSSQLDVRSFMAQLATTIHDAASTSAQGLHS